MHGLPGWLLFAGQRILKPDDLFGGKWVIGTLAILSSQITGVLCCRLFDLVGLPLSFLSCLLFGALISPTNRIAAMRVPQQFRDSAVTRQTTVDTSRYTADYS